MARETKNSEGLGRREFIAGAGAVITGTVSALVVYPPAIAYGSNDSECRVLVHDPGRCVGCGVCGLMCSLYHQSEAGPALSRSDLVRDPFNYEFSFLVCMQCQHPGCYFACPLKDTARLRDPDTGIVHVNEDECIGCGRCVSGCLYDPPRSKLHPETRVSLSCDRCMERAEGPICVEYCNMYALTCMSGEPLRIPSRRSPRPKRPRAPKGPLKPSSRVL